MGFIARHWRGELTLPVSFWVNNLLLLLPLGIAIGALMVWIAAWGQSLQAASISLLVGGSLLLLLSVWAPVGAWRSANTYLAEGGAPGWALATKIVLALGTVSNVGALAVDVLPELPAHLRLAAGHDPIGRLGIVLAPDGRSVTLSGPFSMGAASRFERTLERAPQLQRVLLDSPGGRLFEAHEIATAVRKRGLQTRASGDCASACTLVFLAGPNRSLAPGTRLGFHRASVPTLNPLHDQFANRRLASLYDEAGLPRDFIFRVLATPASTMWFPAAVLLVEVGILPRPSLLLEIDDQTLPADAPLARYRDALANNLLWVALDERRAGAIDEAAQRMLQTRQRGAAADAVAMEGRAVALAAVPVVLLSASAAALDRYLDLLAAELRERRPAGDAACQAVLGTGTDAASASPRLADWLQTALLEPADPQPPRVLTALELEVLRRELGPGGPERIRALVAAPTGPRRAGPGCTKAIELLDAMARLKPAQRRLALRQLLATPA
jgi:hypothetical protein